MRARNAFRLCPFLLIASTVGCMTVKPAKTIDQIIKSEGFYTTRGGRDLAQQYRANLENMVSEIRQHYPYTQLEFVNPDERKGAMGISFIHQNDDPDEKTYIHIWMFSTTEYNTLKTTYRQRAASVFQEFGKNLFSIAYGDKEIMADDRVYGIFVTLQWRAKNFLRERHTWGRTEGISVYAPKSVCGDFVKNRITKQEFLRKSEVSKY